MLSLSCPTRTMITSAMIGVSVGLVSSIGEITDELALLILSSKYLEQVLPAIEQAYDYLKDFSAPVPGIGHHQHFPSVFYHNIAFYYKRSRIHGLIELQCPIIPYRYA